MDSLAGKKFFCMLDMNSEYWQIPVAPEDKEKTAFITRYGLYQFTRMPFGLSNSPASFQRAMHLVLSGLIWNFVLMYLDDINVMGSTFEETLQGRLANADDIQVTPEHVQSIQEWPLPKNKKEVQHSLGFLNYHCRFVPGLAGICAPLYQLTGQKVTWAWDDRHTEAFNALKVDMTSPPVLGYPNAVDTFILDTDASDFAIEAALGQTSRERTTHLICKQVFEYKATAVLHHPERAFGSGGVCTTLWALSTREIFHHTNRSC